MQMVRCPGLLLVPWALACCVACNQRHLVLTEVPLQQAGELMVVLGVLGAHLTHHTAGHSVMMVLVCWDCGLLP
jgi:hypothetical protein